MNLLRRSVLSVMAIGVAGSVPSVCQAQDFTLTVPFRPAVKNPITLAIEDQPQISKVVIVVETTSDMAGPGVSVGGAAVQLPATPCTVNALTCDAIGPFGSGDSSRVTWLAPRRLRVTLRFPTEFPANLCDTTRTVDRTVTLSFSSLPASGNGYRMAGYAVPERLTAANPAPKCDVAFRRVASSPAFLTQTSGTTVTKNGRLPMDVILVLDKSGSMGWSIPGQPGVVRFARLKKAIGEFMELYKQTGAVEGSPDDRMGLVFFDATPADANLSGGTIFKKRSAGWDDAVNGDIISAQLILPGFQPGGNTSIGGGINRAKVRWDSSAEAGAANDATFVVFTDGEQNTPPCVNSVGEADVFPCTTTRTQPLRLSGTTRLMDMQVPMLTIGLGASSGPFKDLLNKIGHDTAGKDMVVANGVELEMAFAEQLVNVLKGNTLSLLDRRIDQVTLSGPGNPVTTFVDGSVRRVTFLLAWEGGGAFGLEVRAPNGTVVTPVVTGGGDGFVVASVDIPASGPVGEWQARPVPIVITAPEHGAGPAESQPTTFPYHLSAYAVEGRLDYHLTVKTAPVGTDLPISVQAEVSFDGKPLDKLPAGAIRITVERPGENFGTILSQSSATGTPQSNGGETQSSLDAKIDQLATSDNLLDRIEPKPLPTSQNMREAGQGVYEAKFDQTVVGGQYRFRVDLNWTDPRTTRIRRNERLEQPVVVRPTPAATVVQLNTDPSGTSAQVSVTLKDAHGNFVGPGFGSVFTVTVDAPAAHGSITNPNDRGVYVIPITGLTPGVNPHITITYDGQVLRDSKLSKVEQASPPYSIGIRAGAGMPHGSFDNAWDPGLGFEADFEYALTPTVAVQGVFGYNRFGGSPDDLDVLNLSARAKFYAPPANPRMAVFAGAGAYFFDPGGTHMGVSMGGVVETQITPKWSVEVTYTLHNVNTPTNASRYSVFHGGFRFHF